MAGRLDAWEPYLPPALLRGLRALRRRVQGEPVPPPLPAFHAHELDELRDLFHETGAAPGSAWDRVKDAHMPLPAWFQRDLDPWTPEYRAQQERLWQLIVGVDRRYDPALDECEAYGW